MQGDTSFTNCQGYIDNYDVIAVEDLETKELKEGESSELNMHIANHAWSEFTSMLIYKASQAGKQVIEVDPDYTTQNCSNSECSNRVDKQLHGELTNVMRRSRSRQRLQCNHASITEL